MSRSGYNDDYGDDDPLALGRWRGAVRSALKGKRGQSFLREMVESLDAMPQKELVGESLQDSRGVCALGAVGVKRGMPLADLDPEDMEGVSAAFGISDAMAREIVYENDDGAWSRETPAERWARMRAWAESWLVKA